MHACFEPGGMRRQAAGACKTRAGDETCTSCPGEKSRAAEGSSARTQNAEDSKAAANAALAAKVKAALAAEHGLEALVIDVDAKDGVVSLFGTADNNANRDKAGRVASKVAGVKSVVNKLVIASGS